MSTNSLFITLFKDVNNYNDIKNIEDIEFIIKLYFPLLSDKSILSFEKFETNNKDLLLKTNNFINESNFFYKKNQLIDLLYNVDYNSKKLESKSKGIENINFNIHSKLNLNISLDAIFKLLNSSKHFPFIKFNPGNKMENIYRFYCNKISKDNKKIPLIGKEKIIKYIQTTGKPNSIVVVLNLKNDIIKEFILELENNGILNVNRIKLYYFNRSIR